MNERRESRQKDSGERECAGIKHGYQAVLRSRLDGGGWIMDDE